MKSEVKSEVKSKCHRHHKMNCSECYNENIKQIICTAG